MLFSDVALLISQTYTVNSIGDPIPTETSRQVFVEVKSIGLKRKIDAMATGLTVDFKLILSDIAEYADEKIVEYKGVRYNVKNVYITDDLRVELDIGRY